MTNTIKAKAQVLKSFLNEKGYSLKQTECIEAVSRVEYGQSYNVAKNKDVRFLKSGEKLSFKEMKDSNFQIDVIISMDLDVMMEGIDAVNSFASEIITGSDYALCDIGYNTYPYFYEDGGVAIRVTGCIEDTETLQYLDDYEEIE